MDARWCGHQDVDQATARVYSHVCLHSKVLIPALAGRRHLFIPLLIRVLNRLHHADDHEIQLHEHAHCVVVADGILDSLVRQIERCLKQVHAKHLH